MHQRPSVPFFRFGQALLLPEQHPQVEMRLDESWLDPYRTTQTGFGLCQPSLVLA